MSQDLVKNKGGHSLLSPSSIPFSIDVYEGFGITEGLIRYSSPNLILEFNTKDSIVGVFSSDVKEITLHLSSLSSIELKSNVFRTKMMLWVNSLKALEKLPGNTQGKAVLRIKRKHKHEAASLVSRVSLELSEYRLQQLDDELDRDE